MNELPEYYDLFAPVKCNLEPEWLSDMAGGYLSEMKRIRTLLMMIGPTGIGPLLLLGSLRTPSPSLPFHIRLFRGIKRILYLGG